CCGRWPSMQPAELRRSTICWRASPVARRRSYSAKSVTRDERGLGDDSRRRRRAPCPKRFLNASPPCRGRALPRPHAISVTNERDDVTEGPGVLAGSYGQI